MRKLGAAALAAILFTSSAFAASGANLAPGKPAGVSKAQTGGNVAMIVFGTAAFGLLAALASGGGSGSGGGFNNNSGVSASTATL